MPVLLVCALVGLLPESDSHGRPLPTHTRWPLRRHPRIGLGARSPEERAVSPMHVLAGLLALGLFGYLLFALLKAERF